MRLNNNAFQKNANISMIAQLLWKNPGISRVELAREVGIYKSTVTNIISTLIENRVAYETESKESALAGRKPIGLRLNEKMGCFLGIEIQPDCYRAIAIDVDGRIFLSRSGAMHDAPMDFAEKFDSIVTDLNPGLAELPLPLLGIAVGIPGLVNPDDGIIIRSYPHRLRDYDFYGRIESRYGIPVLVENDANCCAWGSFLEFRDKRLKDFICLLGEFHKEDTDARHIGGMGVGMAIVMNGKVCYGSSFAAGEFRSVFWDSGKTSQFGISDQDANEARKRPEIYRQVVEELFANLSAIISVLNPSHVVIGGDLARDRVLVTEVMREKLAGRFVVAKESGCAFAFSSLEGNMVAFGAASMLVQKLLVVPELAELPNTYHVDWESIFALTRRSAGTSARAGS